MPPTTTTAATVVSRFGRICILSQSGHQFASLSLSLAVIIVVDHFVVVSLVSRLP